MTPPQNLFPFIHCFSQLLQNYLLFLSVPSAFFLQIHPPQLFSFCDYLPLPIFLYYLHTSSSLLLSSLTADRPDPAWWWHFTHADPSQITCPCVSQSQGQVQDFYWGVEGRLQRQARAQDGQSQRGQVADAWLIPLRPQGACVNSYRHWNTQIKTNRHAFA